MVGLKIKCLVHVVKFLGMSIALDAEEVYMLDQEVTVDLNLKEHG